MCPGAHATTGPSPPARLCGRSAKCAHGFALVELVIALLLLAFIASSLGLLTITATASYVASEQVTEETTSAVDQIEQLIVLPFDDATLAAGGSTTSSVPGYSVDPDVIPNRYRRWQIIQVSPRLKHIKVVAGFHGSGTEPDREVLLETMRSLRQ